ncbi:MAG: tetratricopeptide repeat protein, partial [Candidatus Solibacter sp.]
LAGANEYDRAIAEYNRALELNPRYAEAFNDRGHSYYWKGDGTRAIADFTRAIALRPDYPNAYNNRGATHMAGGHAAMSLADFTRALELKPGFRNAYVNRANAHLRLGHLRQSLDDFHRAGMHPERATGAAAILLMIAAVGLAIRARRRRLTASSRVRRA